MKLYAEVRWRRKNLRSQLIQKPAWMFEQASIFNGKPYHYMCLRKSEGISRRKGKKDWKRMKGKGLTAAEVKVLCPPTHCLPEFVLFLSAFSAEYKSLNIREKRLKGKSTSIFQPVFSWPLPSGFLLSVHKDCIGAEYGWKGTLKANSAWNRHDSVSLRHLRGTEYGWKGRIRKNLHP